MGNMTNSSAEFLVTPEELIHSAQMMNQATEKAKRELEKLSALFQETDTCFLGKAKEAFVSSAVTLVNEWQSLLEGLHNNVSDLQEIALSYKKAEGENIDVIMENDC